MYKKSMDLTDILKAVKDGKMDLETAEKQARGLGFVSYMDIAKLDSHRKSRTGVIEAILADCKDPDDVVEIARVMESFKCPINSGLSSLTRS